MEALQFFAWVFIIVMCGDILFSSFRYVEKHTFGQKKVRASTDLLCARINGWLRTECGTNHNDHQIPTKHGFILVYEAFTVEVLMYSGDIILTNQNKARTSQVTIKKGFDPQLPASNMHNERAGYTMRGFVDKAIEDWRRRQSHTVLDRVVNEAGLGTGE